MKATVALEISLASQTLTKELMNDRSQIQGTVSLPSCCILLVLSIHLDG